MPAATSATRLIDIFGGPRLDLGRGVDVYRLARLGSLNY